MVTSPMDDLVLAWNRRDFMSWVKNGLGSAALAGLLLQDRTLSAAPVPGRKPTAKDLAAKINPAQTIKVPQQGQPPAWQRMGPTKR